MNILVEKQQEQQLAFFVRQTLDGACRELSGDIASRLAQSRQFALEHQKTPATGLQLAGFPHLHVGSLGKPLRTALMIMALVTGMTGTWYWNAVQEAENNIDIDTALLSDDLPVDAYTDLGFRAWLEHNADTDN